MRFTTARELVIVGLVAGILIHLLLLLGYDSLPALPRLAGVTMAVLAVAELLFAISLRARIRGKEGTRPLQPLTAVRAVALAKASSLLGAIMTGGWLALLIYVLPRSALMSVAGGDTVSAVIGVVCAAALIAAALWLEYCCRTPPDQTRRDDGPPLWRSE